MRPRSPTLVTALLVASVTSPGAAAFCGFYVAKADTKLFNSASQVAIAREGERTVITMANDFRGDVNEFAMVIPVPTRLEREQIHITERPVLEHLDAYSAPRLVEYFDEDPCRVLYRLEAAPMDGGTLDKASAGERARSLGVRIEAEYDVGEYDIQILSAEQSDGLVTWLQESGYRIPDGAGPVVRSYLRRGMRFFVAKVDLDTHAELGHGYLRPLQIAFESSRFSLPIRLGMVNADGPQELYVYLLTREGRVETTNYRTVKLPSDMDVPVFVKDDFADFYRAMFERQVERENGRAVFLEYAWDMSWCDPCAADPLSAAELRELGVSWLPAGTDRAPPVFLTRLHLRYDAGHFPQDLVFQETGDRGNYQGRYVIRHPWDGTARCPAARAYLEERLPARRRASAHALARLTGWPLSEIEARMPGPGSDADQPWWRWLWQD